MTDLSLSSDIAAAAPELQPAYPVPAKNGGRPLWSAAETALLHQHYARLGPLAIAPYLPARTVPAIQERARHLGLRCQQPHIPIPSTPALDAALRRLYAKGLPEPGTMRQFCRQWQRNRQWVRNQAIRLGICVPRRAGPWKPDEIAILERLEGRGAKYVQKALAAAGFQRTEPAIAERMKGLGLEVKDKTELMTARAVGELLGLDMHVVTGWIKSQALKARRHLAEDGTTLAWEISRKALRDFMVRYPGEWYPGRCDRYWLVEILAGKVG